MEFRWKKAGEEFWTLDNHCWYLGIDLIMREKEEIGKINLVCRPQKVMYDIPDTEIECTIYKYSSKKQNIKKLYVAIGEFKNYKVVFFDEISAINTVNEINSSKKIK